MRFLRENRQLVFFGILAPLVLSAADKPVMLWLKHLDMIRSSPYVILRHFDPFINFIGHGTTLIFASFLLFFVGGKFSGDLRYSGKALILSFFSAGISVQVLKHIVGRARPRIAEGFVFAGPSLKGGYDSFPSGHSAVVFCFAYILAMQYPRFRSVFYCIAGLIGLMRVVDLSHFPSDVAAGAVLGVVVGKVLAAGFPDHQVTEPERRAI